jgi:hypothetical protein
MSPVQNLCHCDLLYGEAQSSESPDPHGPSNPSVVDSLLAPFGFIEDLIEPVVAPILDTIEAFAQSSKPPLSQPVRNGELLNPAFNSHHNSLNLGDRATGTMHAKPHHFMTNRDELAHSTWVRNSIIKASYFLNEAFTVEKLVFSEPLRPDDALNIGDPTKEIVLSPLEIVSRMHALWHGSLRYRLQYVGPRESTVRLAICFLYGEFPTGPIDYQSAIQFPTIFLTFDSRKRSQTFEAQHISPYRWLYRSDLTSPDAPPSYSCLHFSRVSDYCYFWN